MYVVAVKLTTEKTMNNRNIPPPPPSRSIIDRFPKPIRLNLIGTWQKIRGKGILYVACTWTLASLF